MRFFSHQLCTHRAQRREQMNVISLRILAAALAWRAAAIATSKALGTRDDCLVYGYTVEPEVFDIRQRLPL
jgi:hypothetical protein